MWAVAGVLLGIVLLASVLGFHLGPHSHAFAGVIGVVAAAWLLVMAASGQAAPVLWLLFGTDLAVSAGASVMAFKGLQALRDPPAIQPARLEGQLGVAETVLSPEGVVRVRGESWSATSLNGNLPAGAVVQVIDSKGIRLEVWGEDEASDRTETVATWGGAEIDGEATVARAGQGRAASS